MTFTYDSVIEEEGADPFNVDDKHIEESWLKHDDAKLVYRNRPKKNRHPHEASEEVAAVKKEAVVPKKEEVAAPI